MKLTLAMFILTPNVCAQARAFRTSPAARCSAMCSATSQPHHLLRLPFHNRFLKLAIGLNTHANAVAPKEIIVMKMKLHVTALVNLD
jgi:hypothetical protein